MDVSSLTDEALNRAMNDSVGSGIINRQGQCAVCDCHNECPEIDEHEQKQYLTDWSLTAPLIEQYKLHIKPFSKEAWLVATGEDDSFATGSKLMRTICECTLMIHQAKRS